MPPKKNTADKEGARADALQGFLTQMSKEKPHEVLRLDDNSILDNVITIPTGAISLDVALAAGGFPRGRIIELYGAEGAGKTTLALSVAANCQKAGGVVGFIDAEHALNRELALGIGVDPHELVIYQPSSGEDAIKMIDKMLESKAFDMIIVDSVAALVPLKELEGEIEDQHMALQARLMSAWMKRITASGAVEKSDTMMVLINQLRTSPSPYGNPDYTPGGRAIKFYSSVRIELRSAASKKLLGQNKQVIGQTVTAVVRKNKIGSPHREAEYDLIFGKGIQSEGSLLIVAKDLGVVTLNGATYTDTTTGEVLGVGKEKAKTRLQGDPDLAARITAAVYEALANPARLVPVEPDVAETQE